MFGIEYKRTVSSAYQWMGAARL
eukprot:SAG31_NODE_18490_length_634_cov_0.953271_1_plen_22_part_10